jgi:hypothetical protein
MPADRQAWYVRFTEIMSLYPTAHGFMIALEPGAIREPREDGDRWAVSIEWPYESPAKDWSGKELTAFFDRIAPEYRYRDDRYLRPAPDSDGTEPPSPLMTWWLLLYSLSICSRAMSRGDGQSSSTWTPPQPQPSSSTLWKKRSPRYPT